MLNWDDSFLTGMPSIDVQHKLLILVLNELEGAICEECGGAVAEKILNFLDTYIQSHFNREAQCLEQYRCPIAPSHQHAHAQLYGKVIQYQRELIESSFHDELAERIHTELSEWVLGHIKGKDIRLLRTTMAASAFDLPSESCPTPTPSR